MDGLALKLVEDIRVNELLQRLKNLNSVPKRLQKGKKQWLKRVRFLIALWKIIR